MRCKEDRSLVDRYKVMTLVYTGRDELERTSRE